MYNGWDQAHEIMSNQFNQATDWFTFYMCMIPCVTSTTTNPMHIIIIIVLQQCSEGELEGRQLQWGVNDGINLNLKWIIYLYKKYKLNCKFSILNNTPYSILYDTLMYGCIIASSCFVFFCVYDGKLMYFCVECWFGNYKTDENKQIDVYFYASI